MSGWGLFEAVEMCNAAQIVPIITLFGGMSGETGHAAKRCIKMEGGPENSRDQFGDRACDLSFEAYGDLVEYCHGDNTTRWGKLRISDRNGSDEIFNVTHFEMGNEQYNSHFAAQVAAMEARAKEVGMPPRSLHYLWPQGPGDSPGRADFAPTAADAAAINALGLGTNILADIHGYI